MKPTYLNYQNEKQQEIQGRKNISQPQSVAQWLECRPLD